MGSSILPTLFLFILQEILPQNAMDLHEREIHFVFSFQRGNAIKGKVADIDNHRMQPKEWNDEKIIVFLLCLIMGTSLLFAQDIERNIKERLTDYFAKYTATAKISTPKLNSFDIDYDRRTIQIYASESFAYQPFLPETVETIYNQMKELLPGPVNYYQITIYADGKPIEELVPNLYRSKKRIKNEWR